MKGINILFILSIFTMLVSGCSKEMDYNENSFITKDLVFSDFGRTEAFLSTIYAHLPYGFDGIGGAMRASATDDAVEENSASPIQIMIDGRWSSTQRPNYLWDYYYEGIRSVNTFLKETKGQTFGERRYNDDYQEMMERFNNFVYEARFLRAFFYFQLIKRYKDVPLVLKELDIQDANNVEQASFEDIVEFIVDECNEISEKLPVSFESVPGKETGRITRGAALTLKAETLLFAASPLFNESNDEAKWKRAAIAAKDVIDMDFYSLESNYSDAFNNYNSKELILGRRAGESNSFESRNFPISYEGGHTGTCPSQNLVDAYEMRDNGLSINDPGSGYNPQKPYEGRDPRFKETILYNGASWKGSEIETFNGGKDGPPVSKSTKTGYYLKKFVIESISFDPLHTTSQVHVWPIFRYAEVLLNYAEAMNEVYGPEQLGDENLDLSALDAVNRVRGRKSVSMPGFPTGMSQDAFRKKLYNERRIELAFENKRFWDIRRWKVGDKTTDVFGIEISGKGSNASYSKTLVSKNFWNDKMYFYPLSQNELFINSKLEQNPGW